MEFDALKKIIAEQLTEVSADGITMDTRFVEDLKADSLDVVQIVMALEDQFGIEIPEDAAEHIATVGDAVKALQKALGKD